MQTKRHTPEEIVRLGKEIYEQRIRLLVESANKGRVIAIEVGGGEYEIAATSVEAPRLLRTRVPGAEVYLRRIGYPALHRMGFA